MGSLPGVSWASRGAVLVLPGRASGLPWASLGFRGPPWASLGLPWVSLGFLGLAWACSNAVGHPKASLGLSQLPRALRSSFAVGNVKICEINSKPVAHANEIKYAMGGWGGNARSLRAVGVILTTPSARSLRETPGPKPQAPGPKFADPTACQILGISFSSNFTNFINLVSITSYL